MPKVKKQNSAALRELIYRYGPISRSRIAEMLSLTPATITINVAGLIAAGLVQEVPDVDEPQERAVGRKPVNVDFVQDAGYVVGCELGPYSSYMCVTNLLGHVVHQEKTPVASKNYEDMLTEITKQIEMLIENSGIKRSALLGVGVVLPGFVEAGKGFLRSSLRPSWNERYVAEDLMQKLRLPVRLENNVRARAVREELSRGESRADSFAYFFVSKGIACSLVIKDSLLSAGVAGAGEVGHMVVEKNGEVCEACGNHGCLEAYAGEKAIMNKCARLAEESTSTLLHKICTDVRKPSMREILDAQQKGDEEVGEILQNAIEYLGISLANIINFISPKQVLIDGRLLQPEENRKAMRAVVMANLFGLNETEVALEYLPYSPYGGALGGAALAIKKFLIQG